MTDLRALTFWRPWPDAFFNSSKRCENRPKPPPKSLLGKTIAIHAGKHYDFGDWEYPVLWMPPREEDSPEGIVGTAKILGAIRVRKNEPHIFFVPDGLPEKERDALIRRLRSLPSDHQLPFLRGLGDPWFAGPVGILLDDVVPITPIPCKGKMGYWRVPPQIATEVLARASLAQAGSQRDNK